MSLAMKNRSIEPVVEEWVGAIEMLAKVAGKYLQPAYQGFATSLQAELQYLCECVLGVRQHLSPVETPIRTLLIPSLLQVRPGDVKNELRMLLSHGVKAGDHKPLQPRDGGGPPLSGLRGRLRCPDGLTSWRHESQTWWHTAHRCAARPQPRGNRRWHGRRRRSSG